MIQPLRSWETYTQAYAESTHHSLDFWSQQAEQFQWAQPWQSVGPVDFSDENLNWFVGAKGNITLNALDRHVARQPDRLALLWEPQNADVPPQKFTYRELLQEVEKTAHGLQKLGIKKGDRVCVFLPMIPETVFCLLACARLGAIHVVVFAGYSAEALAQRINDCGATTLITADGTVRGEKIIPLKAIADQAMKLTPHLKNCVVIPCQNLPTPMTAPRDVWWQDFRPSIHTAHTAFQAENISATDPLFILHTSGSTGHPKGVVHNFGGYMVYAAFTFANVFQYHPGEIYWCTADIGWITGHTYGVYGPLLQGATLLMTEGSFLFPQPERLCQLMEKYRVNILYTAPTVLRTMAQFPEKNYRRYDLSSLRRLGSVGEHLDESTWQWYSRVIGRDTCPIVDTWWQTETGGILLATLPGIAPQKPGYSGLPLPGVVPQILKESGELVMTQPWPGLAATLFAQDQRFKDTYFPDSAVVYHTHDKAKIDPEGYVQLLGRNDDVLNISGHRVACAEVERAILESKAVVEAAVIGRPHPITGEEVCIFVVVPQESVVDLDELRDSLNRGVQAQIGRFIRLGPLYVAKELPKTRSGKILRRLLRQLVRGEEIGDTSVLANPEGFALLQQAYKNREN